MKFQEYYEGIDEEREDIGKFKETGDHLVKEDICEQEDVSTIKPLYRASFTDFPGDSLPPNTDNRYM